MGFDMLTTGDSQSLWAECFSVMALAATTTSRPDLAVTVVNPRTRHAAVAASAAATVQQLSGGRFRLACSSGDSALRNLGVPPARVSDVEAYAVAVHEATAGRVATWNGEQFSLDWLADPVPVPVWIAAEGPRMQQMAGRVAQGVVLANCLTEERYACALDNLGRGAAEAGRSVDDVERWHMVNLVFARTEDEGIDSIASEIAGSANHSFRFTLQGKALPEELGPRVQGLMSEYQSRFHAQPGAANPNRGLLDKYGLRSYLARLGTIAGPPERCVERLREVVAMGARNLILSQFVDDSYAWMRTFGDEVLPAFR